MFEVSFPGFGIGPFEINRLAVNAFDGKLQIAWYGILIAFGMICAFLVATRLAKREGIKSDDVIDLALFVLIFSIVGARLYYVIFPPEGVSYIATGGSFWQNFVGTLYNVIAIWEGGLALFGGLIGGIIACALVARHKKIFIPAILDICSPPMLLAQSIGRWGNFMNGEAYGYDTDVIWRMGLKTDVYREVHPTFLYESLWNIIGFVVLMIIYKKKKFHGQMFYLYLMWYGLGRAFIEGLRTDSLPLWGLKDFSGNPIRVSQALAIVLFALGLVLIIIFWNKAKKKAQNAKCAETEKTDENQGDE